MTKFVDSAGNQLYVERGLSNELLVYRPKGAVDYLIDVFETYEEFEDALGRETDLGVEISGLTGRGWLYYA